MIGLNSDDMKKKEYLDALAAGVNAVLSKEKLKEKKILVTGATGLIGSAIVDTLVYMNQTMNYRMEIFAAGRTVEKLEKRFESEKDEIRFVSYDASKEFTFEETVDYIIHCASNAHPAAYTKYPVETMTANMFGTQQLLEYLKRKGAGRLLLVSSSEVYGKKETNDLYREEDYCFVDILNPRACYPSSKRVAETLCACYLQEYRVDSVIVRPGHVYGPTMTAEDSRAYAQFARNVLAGEDIIMKSAGQQLRSYCYVIDCVSALLTVLLEGKSGDAYNISNKDSIVTIREFAEAVAEEAGRKVCMQTVDETEKKGYNLMECSALDAEKLENLGWQGDYPLKRGVKSMLEIMGADVC